jgi:hypothetical protein
MSLKFQNKIKNTQRNLRLILFCSLIIFFSGCSSENEPNIEPTKVPIPQITTPQKQNDQKIIETTKIIVATVDINKIVETVIAKLPTPQVIETSSSQQIPDVKATAVSVLNSILSLTPTLTPFPTNTPTPTPTLTPKPTFTPTPTLIPSIITLFTGSTIVSQSGTQITVNDASAFSTRTDDGLTVDILWGDGTSMKNIAVKDDGSITAKHTYTKAGIFPVKFIVTNQHGVNVFEEINYVINDDK